MESKAAFTKKDVFVVLGCVVFLLANLGAVGSSGRRRAKEAVCLSNLKKWGSVFKMFTDDNNGLFMERLGLSTPETGLKEYYEDDKLLLCPEATKPYDEGGRCPFAAHYYYDGLSSYGHNSWITSRPAANGTYVDNGSWLWKTPNVKQAAKVPMVLDCAGYQNACPWPQDEPAEFDGQFIQGTNLNEIRYVCLNRHNGAVNGVFLDFSVRKIGLKELWLLEWHRGWTEHLREVGLPTAWGDPEHWMYNFKDYSIY